jgi:hypothetical protein
LKDLKAVYRVLISDPLSPEGPALLKSTGSFEVLEPSGRTREELLPHLGTIDAWIVRSGCA